jgi:predicted AAA+ superfamily ATPase
MKKSYLTRLLQVPDRSFFLFGPRGVGKTTWLREVLSDALFFDLLDSSLYLELSRTPGNLEAMIGNLSEDSWIVIDEIQKIPNLLDEVHRLMETKGWKFALSGSSARKLRRGGTNLLGGRALTRNLDAFSCKELGEAFDAEFSLQWGFLPYVQFDRENAPDILNSYVNTYIKEEIKEEGIVRNLPPFLRFLSIAGQLNGQLVNGQNIAREAAVPRSSVDVYFSILEDTLLGRLLPAYRPNVKVREQAHPKFYWFDPGVARAAAGLVFDPVDRLWKGRALENMIYHELRVYNLTQNKNRQIFFYRAGSGVEIDFVIETRKRQPSSNAHIVCVEVKMSERWDRRWERPMRSLSNSGSIHVVKMIGIYTGKRAYHFDGVDVLPVEDFLERLHQGDIF